MHHYQHHIGDYRRDTGHLSNEEDLAYRRMIELYYDLEHPLPENIEWIARRVRSSAQVVSVILADFFVFDEERKVWTQSRCDQEIAEYRKAGKRNRANGKKGGRPTKRDATERAPEPNPDRTDQEPTRNPVGFKLEPTRKATENREPVTVNRPSEKEREREGACARDPGTEQRPKPPDPSPLSPITEAPLSPITEAPLSPLAEAIRVELDRFGVLSLSSAQQRTLAAELAEDREHPSNIADYAAEVGGDHQQRGARLCALLRDPQRLASVNDRVARRKAGIS